MEAYTFNKVHGVSYIRCVLPHCAPESRVAARAEGGAARGREPN